MANSQQLMTALRNAHNAGDTEAATRIAGMIKNTTVAPTGAATPSDHFWNNPENQGSYALTHTGPWKELGNAVGLGVTNLLTGGQTPTGAAHDWYVNNMANPETRHNAEVVQKELPKQLAYGGAAIATEGLSIPALETIGITAPIFSRVAGNAAGSLASQYVGDEDITAGQTAEDILGGELIHGSMKGLSRAGKSIYNTIRETIPESIGGYSQTEKAANVAKPEYINRVLQNDNPEAQYNYRTATSDDAGNSILTPSQTMNTQGGKKYIAAEQRNLRRDADSDYLDRFNSQKSGQSIINAVENPLQTPGPTLQETAENITDMSKQRSNQLYNDSKQQVRDILDANGVKTLKMNFTKDTMMNHLKNDSNFGGNDVAP